MRRLSSANAICPVHDLDALSLKAVMFVHHSLLHVLHFRIMSRTNLDYVSLSCVCVGVGPGGTTSMLAYVLISRLIKLDVKAINYSRVAVVSWFGTVQFEAFVLPGTHVVDSSSPSALVVTLVDFRS